MIHQPIYVTEQGLAQLKAQLHALQHNKMTELAEQLSEVSHDGDYVDNTELQAVQNEFEMVVRRINELRDTIANSKLIADQFDGTHVSIGTKIAVRIDDEEMDTFTLVGSAEADPDLGRISNASPLGSALLGRKVGETVVVSTGDGDVVYHIVNIMQD